MAPPCTKRLADSAGKIQDIYGKSNVSGSEELQFRDRKRIGKFIKMNDREVRETKIL